MNNDSSMEALSICLLLKTRNSSINNGKQLMLFPCSLFHMQGPHGLPGPKVRLQGTEYRNKVTVNQIKATECVGCCSGV